MSSKMKQKRENQNKTEMTKHSGEQTHDFVCDREQNGDGNAITPTDRAKIGDVHFEYDDFIFLKHNFPSTYQGINSILSPAKVGTSCLELKL